MAFSKRMAALTAVVAIPLGVAATSYALTDDPEDPTPPARVEMEGGTSPPADSTAPSPGSSPGKDREEVSPPPVRDGPTTDPSAGAGDDGDDTGDDTGGGNDDDDEFDD